jgi:hypothetical protein
MKNFKAGIDKVYKSLIIESEVPEVTSDDFVMFLQWLAKRTNEDGEALYTPLNIADVVAEPHHYSKEFTEYQAWRESEFGNHTLHPNEDRHTDSEDIIRGTWTETETELIVNIHDVEDRISTVDRDGTPRPGNMRRIEVQMERLLRKMGYDVEAPGERGKYKVQVLWPDKTGKDIGEFKLVPKTVNAAFAYQYSRQPAAVR